MTEELKLDEDIARSLPGGVIDYATHEAIEEALDRADAPMTVGANFMALAERVSALGSQKADLLAELMEARTTLSIIRTQVMVELGRGVDRWEGVPEALKVRLDAANAVITAVTA